VTAADASWSDVVIVPRHPRYQQDPTLNEAYDIRTAKGQVLVTVWACTADVPALAERLAAAVRDDAPDGWLWGVIGDSGGSWPHATKLPSEADARDHARRRGGHVFKCRKQGPWILDEGGA
jgi:hypothetical protein